MDEIYCRGKASIFKTLEQKFLYVSELGRMITQVILENYDDELLKERDKSYTETKETGNFDQTDMGSNLFPKSLPTEQEDGRIAHIYLLDQAMQMEKIGLISHQSCRKRLH